MMRSIAACMDGSRAGSGDDERLGFELGDCLVGEPDLVEFAALKHLHNDAEQPLVGDERVGDRAALAQIVGRDGVGFAHHLGIHDPQSALDQHSSDSPLIPGDKAEPANKFQFGSSAFVHSQKRNRTGPKNGPMRLLGSVGSFRWLPVFFEPPAWPKSQNRYRIWSVQNRSSRCSDLFSVANSSFEMPPTCSTVLTCF